MSKEILLNGCSLLLTAVQHSSFEHWNSLFSLQAMCQIFVWSPMVFSIYIQGSREGHFSAASTAPPYPWSHTYVGGWLWGRSMVGLRLPTGKFRQPSRVGEWFRDTFSSPLLLSAQWTTLSFQKGWSRCLTCLEVLYHGSFQAYCWLPAPRLTVAVLEEDSSLSLAGLF